MWAGGGGGRVEKRTRMRLWWWVENSTYVACEVLGGGDVTGGRVTTKGCDCKGVTYGVKATVNGVLKGCVRRM